MNPRCKNINFLSMCKKRQEHLQSTARDKKHSCHSYINKKVLIKESLPPITSF